MFKNRKVFLGILLIVLSILKLLYFKEAPIQYVGYQDLSWLNLSACNQAQTMSIDSVSEGLILGGGAQDTLCATEKFKLLSHYLIVEFSYDEKTEGKSNPYLLELLDEQNKVIVKKSFPNTSQSVTKQWNRIGVDYDRKYQGTFAKLRVRSDKVNLPKLYIRDRIEFTSRSIVPERISEIRWGGYTILNLMISLVIVVLSISLLPYVNRFELLLLLSIITAVLHLQYSPFFYFDEWHVLQRFSTVSFPESIILTHNEHFLPLYFLTFFLEAKLFGSQYVYYLLTNCILLGVYAYSIYVFLLELSVKENTSRLLSLLFCMSSLHVEALQWAFEASIIMCSILGMCFLKYSIRYFKNSSFLDLIRANICLLIAPFIFGGAFTYLPVGVFAFFLFSFCYRQSSIKDFFFNGVKYIGSLVCTISIPLFFYSRYKLASSGHAVDESSFLADIPALLNYVFTGVGLGSILRPLALYPFLSLTAPQELLDKLLHLNLSQFDSLYFSIATLTVSLFILVISYYISKPKNGRGRNDLFIFLLGLSIIFVYLTIVGFGRWRYGYNQSLALRYQVQVLPGLLFTLVPITDFLFERVRKCNLRYGMVSLVFIAWSVAQLISIDSFMYFRFNGDLDRIYVSAGVETYDKNLHVKIPKISIIPSQSSSITPGRTLADITRTYQWLSQQGIISQKH